MRQEGILYCECGGGENGSTNGHWWRRVLGWEGVGQGLEAGPPHQRSPRPVRRSRAEPVFPCVMATSLLLQCSRLQHHRHPPSKDMPSSLRRDPTSGPRGEQSSYRPTSLKWTFRKLTSITMNWTSSPRNARGELTGTVTFLMDWFVWVVFVHKQDFELISPLSLSRSL